MGKWGLGWRAYSGWYGGYVRQKHCRNQHLVSWQPINCQLISLLLSILSFCFCFFFVFVFHFIFYVGLVGCFVCVRHRACISIKKGNWCHRDFLPFPFTWANRNILLWDRLVWQTLKVKIAKGTKVFCSLWPRCSLMWRLGFTSHPMAYTQSEIGLDGVRLPLPKRF